jgi:alpha-galactosidase
LLSEDVVKATAEALVSTGLAAKGYTVRPVHAPPLPPPLLPVPSGQAPVFSICCHARAQSVNMDDLWAGGRDNATGALFPIAAKFPSGIPALAEFVHVKNLRFGIYIDVGHLTCGKCPGTWGHEEVDAKTFAAWQVDFVKSDSCFTEATAHPPGPQPADGAACFERYKIFDAALKATGRPMVHSIKGPCGRAPGTMNGTCSPPDASAISNLRRCAGDARDSWVSMLKILEEAAAVVQHSRPGFFADLDILEIGNGGLTAVEERTEMTLWCALKSPLLLGNNLTSMSQATLDIVGHAPLLAVNQDPLGKAALRVDNTTTTQVWAGPLSDNEAVLVLLNTANETSSVQSSWAMLAAAKPTQCDSLLATDLWAQTTEVYHTSGAAPAALLEPHEAKALRLACHKQEDAAATHEQR